MERPNIIFVICHDLGKELGCYGKPLHSPGFDRFASEGITFNNAFTNSPACSPSRICVMTGKHAHSSGGVGLAHVGWALPQDVRTVVDCFNEAGYETAHFGVNHERHGGMNHYQIDEERDWDDSDAKDAIDKAIVYLESRVEADKPFYLNIGTQEVHRSSYSRKFDSHYGGVIPNEDVYVPLHLQDCETSRREFGMFQSSIKYLDSHFERLYEALQKLGYLKNSIIIFTTDHGISANRTKGTLYDRGVEVSLLMHLPETMENGKTIDYIIQNIDIAPTVLEAAGISVPPDMQGTSFLPLLKGETYSPHEEIFIERNFHGQMYPGDEEYSDVYDPVRAVRTPEFHYIRYFKPDAWGRAWMPWEEMMNDVAPEKHGAKIWKDQTEPRKEEELFHVSQDSLELVDVSDRPEYAEIKADLRGKLQTWMEETGDFALTDTPPERYNEPGWGDNWPRRDQCFRFEGRTWE